MPIMLLSILTGACRSGPPPGALAPEPAGIALPDCDKRAHPLRQITPPQWYQMMQRCIQQQDFHAAAISYLLAGTWSWFDASRLGTRYAAAGHASLPHQTLMQLSESQRGQLWQTLNALMSDSQYRNQLCQTLRALGPPTYQPDYLAKNSVTPLTGGDYSLALNGYLHCDMSLSR